MWMNQHTYKIQTSVKLARKEHPFSNERYFVFRFTIHVPINSGAVPHAQKQAVVSQWTKRQQLELSSHVMCMLKKTNCADRIQNWNEMQVRSGLDLGCSQHSRTKPHLTDGVEILIRRRWPQCDLFATHCLRQRDIRRVTPSTQFLYLIQNNRGTLKAYTFTKLSTPRKKSQHS